MLNLALYIQSANIFAYSVAYLLFSSMIFCQAYFIKIYLTYFILKIITLHYYDGFCHKSSLISHRYACDPLICQARF